MLEEDVDKQSQNSLESFSEHLSLAKVKGIKVWIISE